MDPKPIGVARQFVLNLLPAFMLVTGLAWFWSDQLQQQHLAELMATQQGHFDVAEQLIQKEFFERTSDLHVLADLPALRSFLDDPSESSRQRLEVFLLHFASTYAVYDQIRVLDPQGHESVRINREHGLPQVVPPAALQDKSDRPYFKEAIQLDRGLDYLSPLDLNVEKGQLEWPLKPAIRLAIPVFDTMQVKRGILVLNYLPESLLHTIESSLGVQKGQEVMLLNDDGYYLKHPDPALEWGWLLGHPENNFAQSFPGIWASMARSDRSGAFATGHGMLIARQLKPLLFSPPLARAGAPSGSVDPVLAQNYRWILLKFIPGEALRPDWFPVGTREWLSVAGLLLLVIALPAWAFASRTDFKRRALHKLHQHQLIMNDLYEHAPCGYQSLDREGLFIRMNQTLLDWLGYRSDELVGKAHFRDLLTPDSLPVFVEHFPALLASGQIQDCRVDMLRRDGSILPVSITANVIRDDAGNFASTRATVIDITEQRRLQQELEQQAQTDVLTGLCNRRHFYALGKRELARSDRSGAPLSLLMLDIDHFKSINDQHGHEMGDQALVAMARASSAELRENDLLARLGGEEFAVLLPDTDIATARHVAERLREAVAQLSLTSPEGAEVTFTVSIGISRREDGPDGLDAMLKRADLALYRAKASGRNQAVVQEGADSSHSAV